MKISWAILFSFGTATLLLPAVAQSAQTDLPSAPSSVMVEKQQRAKPAPAQPATDSNRNSRVPADSPAAQTTSGADDTPSPEENPAAIIRKQVNEVNVIFTVTDKHNRFVRNLSQQDFKVLDDKKLQPSITTFRAETDLPLRTGLLVDASNSVRDRFKFEQQSAIEFLNQIIRPRFDKAFVIGFDTTAEVTQDFTDNSEALSRGVRMLRPGGGTALYDALYYACRDKLAKAASERGTVRRAIILLSDGEDNQSRVTREEAIEMAQRAEVIIYAISTNVSGVKQRGDRVLERITEATGGRAFFPFRVQELSNAFTEIQDELRSQYALAYRPLDFQRDGRYHSIDILAQKHKDLHVRARRGYFAPAQ
ncbi:MAG TPA: VWA domain-containing protein [Terriglobales bacterium]|nr:VWA domain-containing protein [Terriglobales bacterium]